MMRTRKRTRTFCLIVLPIVSLLASPFQGDSQEGKIDWRRRFKHARYVVFSWEGSIERYQLSLLQNSLTGKIVDDMIIWREEAKKAIAKLHGCPPEYKKPLEMLKQISDLLHKQESICTNRKEVIAHLEDWRANRKTIKELHKKLNKLLKL